MPWVVVWGFILAVSLGFWTAVSMIAGVAEPWDAAGYWTIFYPAALVLSAVLALLPRRFQWAVGAVVIFAQVPVVLAVSGIGPLLAAGGVIAATLSIPAMVLSWLSGRTWRIYRGL
ncbi:Uncharacterised protein [Paucimonas lemoignei]|nr:Uncharacterised protein [Paucimonas lemoignei]